MAGQVGIVGTTPVDQPKYVPFGVTKSYFSTIRNCEMNVKSIAALVSAIVFPIFLIITSFTLLADFALAIVNCFSKRKTDPLDTQNSTSATPLSKPLLNTTPASSSLVAKNPANTSTGGAEAGPNISPNSSQAAPSIPLSQNNPQPQSPAIVARKNDLIPSREAVAPKIDDPNGTSSLDSSGNAPSIRFTQKNPLAQSPDDEVSPQLEAATHLEPTHSRHTSLSLNTQELTQDEIDVSNFGTQSDTKPAPPSPSRYRIGEAVEEEEEEVPLYNLYQEVHTQSIAGQE